VAAAGVHNFTGLSLTSNKTYTLTCGDADLNPSSSASTSVLFYPKLYYGDSALTSLTSAQIVGLANNYFASSRSFSQLMNGNNNYLYVCYPSSFGVGAIWVNGLQDASWIQATVSVTNASGYTQDYYTYRSSSTSSGTGISIEVR
jgi:hypothetical protein